MSLPLGSSLPPDNPHGVSVSLPLWQDTVGWANRDETTLQKLTTGYPRFFVPRVVRRLAKEIVRHVLSDPVTSEIGDLGDIEELDALLFPGKAMAVCCLEHLRAKSPEGALAGFVIDHSGIVHQQQNHSGLGGEGLSTMFAVIFRGSSSQGEPKACWQHTGYGISSRCASYWLSTAEWLEQNDEPTVDMPSANTAAISKAKLRSRIARFLSSDATAVRGEDIWLFHTGMSAIAHSAQLLSGRGSSKPGIAVFGFLYVDTVKVLSHVLGFPHTLYSASDHELDRLEADLRADPARYGALYLEFPGNPLLGSPDLLRIWELSRKYEFAVIIDDTVGTAINLDLIGYADMVCTSLTKMFSGACNAMGGSLALNAKSAHYHNFRQKMDEVYLDTYFPPDAVIMENNSIDFAERVKKANHNAELVVDLLSEHPQVAQVYYPKGSPSQAYYDRHRRVEGGYGFLLSIIFTSPAAAIAFYDALDVAKGPSLGTNFTLSCAYTLLAHAKELEWAARYGVTEYLVRISVGIEESEALLGVVESALAAAAENASM